MKNNEKKELLAKLKGIGRIEPKQRFSEKVFRHLRSNNQSNEASFQADYHLSEMGASNNWEGILSPIPKERVNEVTNTSELNCSYVKRNHIKANFKKNTQDSCRDYTDQAQYLSFRNQSTQRIPRMSKTKPDYMASQNLSTITDLYNKLDEKMNGKCPECIKRKVLRDEEIEEMTQEVKSLKEKLQDYKQKYQVLKKGVQPYINNVSLMSVILESLTQKDNPRTIDQNYKQIDPEIQTERNQLKETARVNMWLLKEGMQKDKNFNNQKYRLKCEIDTLAGENIELKRQIKEKDEKMKVAEDRVKNFDQDHPLRERLQMCGQQLYAFKLKYHETLRENDNLNLKIEQMKYKLNVLTSLIGCAIIFDVHQKENDKRNLKQILNKIDKYENITNSRMDNNVFQYLKILKSEDGYQGSQKKERNSNRGRISKRQEARQSKQMGKTEQKKVLRKLYYPNYLILLGEESISARLEHIVIKPTLFIKIRSILDSKYIDYRLYESQASKFPTFCNSHIRSYEVQESEKKAYFITRMLSQNQIKEINIELIRSLMDERIEDIPEVEIFRDMILGKYEEDEIYFYLMCRHKFLEGSELQNFINSGDPSKFIKFDKAKRIVIKITQKFGRNIQNFICHHLNERKIVKGTLQFTRLYYLLKLLLLVYRKIRQKKLLEMKQLFNHILITTMKDRINFMQFYELLRKNFQFLSRTEICSMYQSTIAIFESQNSSNTQIQFFQCFSATCSSRLFLQEMIKFDNKLTIDCEDEQMIINYKNDSLIVNNPVRDNTKYKLTHLKKGTSNLTSSQFSNNETRNQKKGDFSIGNQLWPDSVYILGNQKLTRQYYELVKSNPAKLRNKLDTLQFLVNVAMGHLVKQDIHLYCKQDLHSVLNDANFNMVQYLNKLQNRRLEHQNEVNSASRKLGKFFKNKIYEFYHEMLEDIDKITTPGEKKPTNVKKTLHKKEVSAMKTEKMI